MSQPSEESGWDAARHLPCCLSAFGFKETKLQRRASKRQQQVLGEFIHPDPDEQDPDWENSMLISPDRYYLSAPIGWESWKSPPQWGRGLGEKQAEGSWGLLWRNTSPPRFQAMARWWTSPLKQAFHIWLPTEMVTGATSLLKLNTDCIFKIDLKQYFSLKSKKNIALYNNKNSNKVIFAFKINSAAKTMQICWRMFLFWKWIIQREKWSRHPASCPKNLALTWLVTVCSPFSDSCLKTLQFDWQKCRTLKAAIAGETRLHSNLLLPHIPKCKKGLNCLSLLRVIVRGYSRCLWNNSLCL